ncbi:unnamed protein product [Coregonus sp. 'balchen']|nr:unnamed protein product [Coregonus sp. 'balchen']
MDIRDHQYWGGLQYTSPGGFSNNGYVRYTQSWRVRYTGIVQRYYPVLEGYSTLMDSERYTSPLYNGDIRDEITPVLEGYSI